MTSNLKRKPIAQRLRTGLTEAVRHAKGELTLRTVRLPEPPPAITAKEVTSLRTQTGMSQAVFALVLNVSTKTVQSWEQGERKPSRAALRMLQLFREYPALVVNTVGIPAEAKGRTPRRANSKCQP